MRCSPAHGVHIRTFEIGRQLKKCGAVTFLGVDKWFDEKTLSIARRDFDSVILLEMQEKNVPKWLARVHGKYKHHWAKWCSDPVSGADRNYFDRLLADHDLVWFHSFYAADCFREYRILRSIIDIDDLNFMKYQWKAGCACSFRQRFSDQVVSSHWKRREMGVLERFTLAAVCSEADRQVLGGGERIHVIPNGLRNRRKNRSWENGIRCGWGLSGRWRILPTGTVWNGSAGRSGRKSGRRSRRPVFG